ncbi:hypothetical protein L6164_031644 [Bauhinia variegata]|uniref:Uncharacterized protein n=1 Tax=Bauhinia variegata TaxID=167791 RepID=A0ACB9LGE5_BAUVA|nr:hypothetical protein L6164_031644 [Bauhinia variegata]
MKVAPKVVFLFRDREGFASAILDSLHPNSPSSLRRLEDSFELSLEGYGITDHKASGNIFHYVDDQGIYQVSVVAMQHYEPPVISCAVNEVLAKIAGDKSSLTPTLLVPFIMESYKIKGESKSLTADESKTSLVYGIQIGEETGISQTLVAITLKPPSSLQIYHETCACFLHFARVLKLSTFFLIGQTGQHSRSKSTKGELEILHAISEILSSTTGLHFSKDKITWNPTMTAKESKEPWRALYG